MPRSKKQPEYDPNELADLIETPAVGKGVGSHLLAAQEDCQEVTIVVTSLEAPVVDSISSSVDTTEAAPILPPHKPFPAPATEADPAIPVTQVNSLESTLDEFKVTIEDKSLGSPVDTFLQDTSQATTVVTSQTGVLSRLWISDSGEIVPESRVHRVAAAADALSNGEATLYNLLLGAPALRETKDARSVQAGYDSLTKRTGFSRKTIQRTIDRLIAKHYIEIETPADIYSRTPTVYRVHGTAAVLNRLTQHSRTHVAKIGPGVAFVMPLSSLSDSADTVDTSDSGPVVPRGLSTVDNS